MSMGLEIGEMPDDLQTRGVPVITLSAAPPRPVPWMEDHVNVLSMNLNGWKKFWNALGLPDWDADFYGKLFCPFEFIPLATDHLLIIRTARQDQAKNLNEQDSACAAWIEWWMEWALKKCKRPCMYFNC